jgi:hypothetical protein
VCQKQKGKTIACPRLLPPLPIIAKAWINISMEFIDGLPSSHGKTTILVVLDRLTKYVDFCSSGHPYTALTSAQLFVDNIVKLYGLPQLIASD